MRRLLAMICFLVLATTLVARGGGIVTCAEGRSCCAMPTRFAAMSATTAPTTSPSCRDDDKPAPVSHGHSDSPQPHAAMPIDMPCCGMVAWTPTFADAPLVGAAIVRDVIATNDEPRSIANAEPATPPPRSIA